MAYTTTQRLVFQTAQTDSTTPNTVVNWTEQLTTVGSYNPGSMSVPIGNNSAPVPISLAPLTNADAQSQGYSRIRLVNTSSNLCASAYITGLFTAYVLNFNSTASCPGIVSPNINQTPFPVAQPAEVLLLPGMIYDVHSYMLATSFAPNGGYTGFGSTFAPVTPALTLGLPSATALSGISTLAATNGQPALIGASPVNGTAGIAVLYW